MAVKGPMYFWSIEDLEAHFKLKSGDLSSLLKLEQVLSSRTTARGKKLRDEVHSRIELLRAPGTPSKGALPVPGKSAPTRAGGMKPKSASPATTIRADPPKPLPIRTAPQPNVVVRPSTVFGAGKPSGSDDELRQILRDTFTEEGELLARWGMTPRLPQEMQASVFGLFVQRLAAGPLPDGRDAASLERDRARLASLRAGRAAGAAR
jgi:hypothetical protein